MRAAVFLGTIAILVTILGTAMYLVEGAEHGFTSIPVAVYWSIVTMTTVGYGDLAPQTPLGKMLASVVMVLGYGIIAVPTGIVTAEIVDVAMRRRRRDEPEPATAAAAGSRPARRRSRGGDGLPQRPEWKPRTG